MITLTNWDERLSEDMRLRQRARQPRPRRLVSTRRRLEGRSRRVYGAGSRSESPRRARPKGRKDCSNKRSFLQWAVVGLLERGHRVPQRNGTTGRRTAAGLLRQWKDCSGWGPRLPMAVAGLLAPGLPRLSGSAGTARARAPTSQRPTFGLRPVGAAGEHDRPCPAVMNVRGRCNRSRGFTGNRISAGPGKYLCRNQDWISSPNPTTNQSSAASSSSVVRRDAAAQRIAVSRKNSSKIECNSSGVNRPIVRRRSRMSQCWRAHRGLVKRGALRASHPPDVEE